MANMVQNLIYRVTVSAIVGAAVAAGVLFMNSESKYGRLQADLAAVQAEAEAANASQLQAITELQASVAALQNMQGENFGGVDARLNEFSAQSVQLDAIKTAIASLAEQTSARYDTLTRLLDTIRAALEALSAAPKE